MKEIIVKIVRENSVQYCAEMPSIVAKYWKEVIATREDFDCEKETLACLILNSKLKVKAHTIVSIGLLNQTVCHAREVFRSAIAYAGHSIIIVHNHPSGDVSPSSDDLRATKELLEAGRIIGIPLLDSVIVSSNGDNFTSLKEKGLFNY